jgi:uncharacterized protein (TIGR03118 family)
MGDGDTGNAVELGTSNGTDDQATAGQKPKPGTLERVTVTPLARDQALSSGEKVNIVPSLTNAWGMAVLNRNLWIAGNATGKVPIVNGDGVPSTGAVMSGEIFLEIGITGVAATGAEPGDDVFPIHKGSDCRSAQLLFVSEKGNIFGVTTDVSNHEGFIAAKVVKADAHDPANFKGAAILQRDRDDGGPLLLAADFKHARIDVFKSNFDRVMGSPFSDVAKALPPGPKGARFAPFNVLTTADHVFIAFALQNKDKDDAVTGEGLGFVVQLDKTGNVIAIAKNEREHGRGRELDAPWGMVVTCNNFDPARNALLVGNFGDGHITAFDLHDDLKSLGQLETQKGKPVMIDGLWDLVLGTGVQNADPGELFFTAGPKDETRGLFGKITSAESEHKH